MDVILTLCYLGKVFNVVSFNAKSVIYYLNVSFIRLMTSVGEETLVFCCFYSKNWIWVLIASVPDLCILFTSISSSGCLGKASYFIVVLPGPSINYFVDNFATRGPMVQYTLT